MLLQRYITIVSPTPPSPPCQNYSLFDKSPPPSKISFKYQWIISPVFGFSLSPWFSLQICFRFFSLAYPSSFPMNLVSIADDDEFWEMIKHGFRVELVVGVVDWEEETRTVFFWKSRWSFRLKNKEEERDIRSTREWWG